MLDEGEIHKFMQDIINMSPPYVYVLNGTKDHEIDCLKFFALTQKRLFGRDIPLHHLDSDDLAGWIKLVVHYKKELHWNEIPHPIHGCAVEMSHHQRPYHIGTWLDLQGGGVLHCTPKAGVTFQSLKELQIAGWNRIVYDAPPSP